MSEGEEAEDEVWRADVELPRDAIRRVLRDIAPAATNKALQTAERDLSKALAVALCADGYTINLAGDALGVPGNTLRSWRKKDAAFAAGLGAARDIRRRWLLGTLRVIIEERGKAAGQAVNILANLWFTELRTSKVEATVQAVPQPGEARETVLGILNKAKPLELPVPLALPDEV